MHRRVGTLFIAAALATAGLLPALALATPAGATTTCGTAGTPTGPGGVSNFGNHVSDQVGVAVACSVDFSSVAATNANHLTIHDMTDAEWHRGAARDVSCATTTTTTLGPCTSGVLTPLDKGRPVSGPGLYQGGTGQAASSFIVSLTPSGCTIACTGAVISRPGAAAQAAHNVRIEHTRARILNTATYTGGTTVTLTVSAPETATFQPTDVGLSVSGSNFPAGSRISAAAANASTATVISPTAITAKATASIVTIGAARYSPVTPATSNTTTYTDTWTRDVGPGGVTSCTGSPAMLTLTASGGGFRAGATSPDIDLPVVFTNRSGVGVVTVVGGTARIAAGPPAPTATAVKLVTPTGAAFTCPTAGTYTDVTIGAPPESSSSTLAPGAVMASLSAQLNLAPTLVGTQDACTTNTYEGFQVEGGWYNPGTTATNGYASGTVLGAHPAYSVGQVAYITGVVNFGGYIIPHPTGDAQITGYHYDFDFPTLPTSLAVCALAAGVTTNKIGLELRFNATTLSAFPTGYGATGAGNPSSPQIRDLSPLPGTFAPKIQFLNGPSTQIAIVTGPSCVVKVRTTAPDFGCGLG